MTSTEELDDEDEEDEEDRPLPFFLALAAVVTGADLLAIF